MKKLMVLAFCILLIGCTGVREEVVPTNEVIEKVETIEQEESFYIDFSDKGKEISKAVLETSEKHDCPIPVVLSLISSESGPGTDEINEETVLVVNPSAKSKKNCIGLTQCSEGALIDYNKANGTSYTMDDLLDIRINIEVGVWHYMRYYKYYQDWTELYIIYNVGFNKYTSVNPYVFKGYDGNDYQYYYNRFFFLRNMYPPTASYQNSLSDPATKLPAYKPKERFEKCYGIYLQLLAG